MGCGALLARYTLLIRHLCGYPTLFLNDQRRYDTIMAQVDFLSFTYHEWDGAEWDGNHAYEKKWRFDFINHTKGGYDTIPMTECSEVKLRLRTRTLIHPDFFLGRD